MRENEPDVLEMLIRHELALKELYTVFAAAFATRQDLWQGLARDEQRHADQLGTLRSEPAIDTWLSRESRLKPQAIRSSIDYVERQIARAHGGHFSLLQALSIARDLENALLEKQFSRLSDPPSGEIGSILTALSAETEGHRKALVDAIGAEKRQSS